MSKETKQYEIERRGAADYVIVWCPNGHRNRALKAPGDLHARQDIVCGVPRCSEQWTALLPMNNGFEADE